MLYNCIVSFEYILVDIFISRVEIVTHLSVCGSISIN